MRASRPLQCDVRWPGAGFGHATHARGARVAGRLRRCSAQSHTRDNDRRSFRPEGARVGARTASRTSGPACRERRCWVLWAVGLLRRSLSPQGVRALSFREHSRERPSAKREARHKTDTARAGLSSRVHRTLRISCGAKRPQLNADASPWHGAQPILAGTEHHRAVGSQ